MGLRIANNIPAMTTHRWLGVSDAGLTKSLERLSSGYRINRAADDAAGLAISQSFRADIASFKVASRNASEASALLQVAEGGIDQIANMLTRLKELATQASSANAGSSEREKIASEAEELKTEIERIANVTMYGSSALLDGSFGASKTGTPGAPTDYSLYSTSWNYYDFGAAGALSTATVVGLGSEFDEGTWYLGVTGSDTVFLMNNAVYSLASVKESYAGVITVANSAVAFANLGVTINIAGSITNIGSYTGAAATLTLARTGLTSLNVENATIGTFTFTSADANELTLGNGSITETVTSVNAGDTVTFSKLNVTFTLGTDYTEDDLEGMTFSVSSTGASGSTFQIGAENTSNNQIAISIDSVTTDILGIDGLDLSEASTAQAALDLVDTAISTLAGSRGNIGAYMNRLSYAAANLSTTIENVQAAESVIRDVDMAMEMTEFTKNQILLQAGTAMLAQANMAPQQVLALFG